MKRLSLCCIIFALFLAGCVTTQTALQRRTYEAKELEGTIEDAFKATLQVLQDHGYIIKNTDRAGGVIQGETGIKKEFWTGDMTNMEITATLEQFGANTVKERLSLISKVKNSTGYGTKENSEIIDDPEMFQKMYDEIQKEMFIRKNLNK